MKGLLKYLAPFAPDQSGAAGVFYDMDCITVVCDAGGCIGNYCGFDEPRWFDHKSPIFSAGLRDMDAILGRDDRMLSKLQQVTDRFESRFAVLIGTPVPAVIGTDYKALKRMASKKCGLPVLGVECSGTGLYDAGEEAAYLELFRNFAGESQTDEALTIAGEKIGTEIENHRFPAIVGIIGATPLELTDPHADEKLRDYYLKQGYDRVFCYGMGDGYEALQHAGEAEKNVVLTPAGIRAAEYLKKVFGTPYVLEYKILDEKLRNRILQGIRKHINRDYCGAGRGSCQEEEDLAISSMKNGIDQVMQERNLCRVLVIHQQVIAEAVREMITQEQKLSEDLITVASFFAMTDQLRQKQDIHLETEQDLRTLLLSGNFDLVIADKSLKKAVREYQGDWISFPHFAVSGSRDSM